MLTIRQKLKWYSLIPEMAFSLATMIFSLLYHMCDAGHSCSKICVADWELLYKLDFIFSYQIIHIVITYTTNYKLTAFKSIYLIMTLVGNAIYVNVYKDRGFDNYFYIIIIGVGILMTLCRFLYLYQTNNLTHEMKHHFDYRAIILASLCAVIGLLFKFLTPGEYDYYYWGHSLWHIFISLAIYFALNIYDLSPMLCGCVKKTQCAECENEDIV
jgi:hypothetical protein